MSNLFSWISNLYHSFLGHQTTQSVVEEKSSASRCPFLNPAILETKVEPIGASSKSIEECAVYPEFDKALTKFNALTDIMVMSEDYIVNFDSIYKEKLAGLGNKLILFPKGFLVPNNVAIVTAGYKGYNMGKIENSNSTPNV